MTPLKITAAQMVAKARARIEEVETPDLIAMLDDPDLVVVDIRDIRERQRSGAIPGSIHAPRGMIEFWVDPDSFELFRDLRESLWERDFEVGWKPVDHATPLQYCSGYSQSR
ncbi:MAG: rhodanese-like domain-containing protein, partial [Pseudomonadota bacterium]|nr:rhodanese-like domain-containing protein [Pseudomonadota bacterium]